MSGRACAMVCVGERRYPAELLVFDKDGLLFQSQPFWCALASARLAAMRPAFSEATVQAWLRLIGVRCNENGVPVFIDPAGILALAPQAEEEAVLAAVIIEQTGGAWSEVRARVHDAFTTADETLNLSVALQPQPGFPEIFHRAHRAGLPLGVATSDTTARVRDSLSRFGADGFLSFIVTPEDVASAKPAPDMLARIARDRGVSPGRIVMIGDSFVDTEMARAAGAIGIGVPETREMSLRMQNSASAIANTLDDIRFEPME